MEAGKLAQSLWCGEVTLGFSRTIIHAHGHLYASLGDRILGFAFCILWTSLMALRMCFSLILKTLPNASVYQNWMNYCPIGMPSIDRDSQLVRLILYISALGGFSVADSNICYI